MRFSNFIHHKNIDLVGSLKVYDLYNIYIVWIFHAEMKAEVFSWLVGRLIGINFNYYLDNYFLPFSLRMKKKLFIAI